MPPFDRRRSFPGGTAFGRTAPAVFTSDDLDRDLTALMQDPLYWRERDRDFADHVTRQFERVHGPDGPTPDGDGKRRGTLEVPRLRRRPGDERLKQPVGRDAPNRPDDVTRLQRALSETGDYTFTAPRERSGVMTPNLETAVTRYQRRTGLNPDGVVAPNGPTVQQIAAEAERGFSDTPVHAEPTPASDDLKGPSAPQDLLKTANAGSEAATANAEENETVKSDGTKNARSQCKEILDDLNKAHDTLNGFSENARQKSVEIENMRKAISKVADLEDYIKQEVWDAAVGAIFRRFFVPFAIYYEIKGDIERIDKLRTLRSMRKRLQDLLDENSKIHDGIKHQTKKVERLRAKYNDCRAKPAHEDRNESVPDVPVS
jgi:hypothetical protein